MVNVTAKVIQDARSRQGRLITIQIITDDKEINKLINSPYIFRKTYPQNSTSKDVKQDVELEVTSLVLGAKSKITDETLMNREFKFEV